MTDRFFEERLQKLDKIRTLGIRAYPDAFKKNHTSQTALREGEKGVRDVEAIKQNNAKTIVLSGRLTAIRDFGKLTFAHLLDDQGKIQICFQKGNLTEKEEKLFMLLDIGDFIGVQGELFKTKHGEITLLVGELTFLGKALRPLPEKWHGIRDQEACYRQRYLDLIMNQGTRARFDLRSKILQKLREFYWAKGFTEIETPVLENISSGAAARPFITSHNALDIDLYLRIAAGELWQKMAIVGGYEKTFEVARCFRNEGMDPSHLQEFTMIEHYAAYWNYEDNMRFTEEMLSELLLDIMGTTKINVLDRENRKNEIDFTPPWPRRDYREMILEDCGIDILEFKDAENLHKAIYSKGIVLEDTKNMGYGNLVDYLYKKVSRPKLIQPCFVIHHPADTKPLARRNDENEHICDTFQLLVNTWEVVNAYSELVDPIDQRKRLERQANAKAGGDKEAMSMNEDYLKAMEYGMPPISGWGMGIDRLVTLLTCQDNLRDSVMFPLLRPSVAPPAYKMVTDHDSDKPFSAGISYEKAKALLEENIKDPIIRLHCRESEVVLRALAKHFGEDEELWGIAGLLHDIDFEQTKNDLVNHGVLCGEILKNAGASDEMIRVIFSHVYGSECGNYGDKKRETRFEHALAAGETVTGLIYAYALMRPDKKLENVELASIKKKFKDKAFAAKVDRDVIKECELIGLPLSDFLTIALNAMKGIAREMGL